MELNALLDFDDFTKQLESILAQIRTLASEDKLFRATKLQAFITKSIEQYEQMDGIDAEIIKNMKNKVDSMLGEEFVNNLKRQSNEMELVLNILGSNEGWILARETSGVRSYYRHEPNSDIHSIKLQGIIESPLLNVLAVLYELDLYKNWWPLSKMIKEITKTSRYQKIVHMIVDLPWPMWNRDTLLYAYGIDNLEDNRLMICFRSCTSAEEATVADKISAERCVRSEWKIGGMLMVPISPTQTEVSICVNADPKFDFMPTQVMNTFTKMLSPLMFERLRQFTKDIKGTEYEKRVEQQPEIYQEIKNRLDKHFAEVDNEASTKESLQKIAKATEDVKKDSIHIGKHPKFVVDDPNLD